jgi:cell shape-determining protein MreD
MNKRLKFVLFFLIALAIFIFQFSFINSLPGVFTKINLILFFIIWFFIFYNFKTSLVFSIFIGLILDIFSFYPFGVFTFILLLTVMLADFVWENLFTNRSIYSFLAISFILVIFYNISLYSLLFFFESNLFGVLWFGGIFWLNLFLELAWIVLGVTLSFYLISQKRGRTTWLSFDKK